MCDTLVDAIFNHWDVVVSAPIPFMAIALLASAAGWLIRKAWDRHQLSIWQDLVSNASPIEVASRIDQLNAEIAHLRAAAWRSVNRQQREKFQELTATIADKTIFQFMIYCPGIDSEPEAYARNLLDLFKDAGFVSVGIAPQIIVKSTGLCVLIQSRTKIPQRAKELSDLLNNSGIATQIIESEQIGNADNYCLVVGKRALA